MTTIDHRTQSMEITCSRCSTINRVPLKRMADRPICGRCKTGLTVAQPVVADDATFDTLIQHSALPVLVDFWAPWCGPCRAVAPELEKVAQQKQGELLVVKINSDENPQVSSRLGIRAIPTLVLFRDGLEARRLQGAMPAAQILSQMLSRQ